MVGLVQAIQRRWMRYTPLNRLIDHSRVRNGNVHSGGLPYVNLRLDGGGIERSSEGIYELKTIAFEIMTAAAADGAAAASKALKLFNRQDFEFDGGRVLDMRPDATEQEEAEDGVWMTKLPFTVSTFTPHETLID